MALIGMPDMQRFKTQVRRRMPGLYSKMREKRNSMRAARVGYTEGGPASLRPWLDRLPDQRRLALPEQWLPAEDRTTAPRVAVVVHVFFPELVDQIVDSLDVIPVPFDLLVTNASGTRIDITCPAAASVRVLEIENHGRDIWPLVQVVNAGLLDTYEIVLKLHTKRSEWRKGHELAGSGGQWREALLRDLVGSRAHVSDILGAFAQDPHLGSVTSDESILGPEFWGGNEATTRELARRLELDFEESDLVFAAGSMYWVRGFVLQGLRGLNMSRHDFEEEAGQINATTAHAIERLLGVLVRESGLRIEGVSATGGKALEDPPYGLPVEPRVRVVPFYLPQYHPVPENDRWWGRGFTEWTNVSSARPVFLGHHQPKLPTTTGFYDLRLPESVALQNDLARSAGVYGFMYYHYWFAGRQILERPLQDRLKSDDPTPFCMMWANENWTRRWDGRSKDVLLGQDYEHVPSSQFIQDALQYLLDPRYLRVDGKAVLAVYRPGQIPNLAETVAAWRKIAEDAGVGGLLLLSVDVDAEFDGLSEDSHRFGFDGTLGFPPHRTTWPPQKPRPLEVDYRFHGNILSYQDTVAEQVASMPLHQGVDTYPGVMVTFDNTARRQWSSDIWYGSNPYSFHRWLLAAAEHVSRRLPEHRMVFVNAWNEWAEGAVLEPQDRYGSSYLLAVRSVVDSVSRRLTIGAQAVGHEPEGYR
jgi:lipopolysaccharide biosynthesis protein